MEPGTMAALGSAAASLYGAFSGGGGPSGASTQFLNNRANQTNIDMFELERNRAISNDLVAQNQWNKSYSLGKFTDERNFRRQTAEWDAAHQLNKEQFALNRTDRAHEFKANMQWSKDQYNRAEAERARNIQTQVADATAAGVHPLFALGASPGYSGGSSLPGGGSSSGGGASGSSYGSTGIPSPQGPGGTVSGSAAGAGLQAMQRGNNRAHALSNAVEALGRIGELKSTNLSNKLAAAKTNQEIAESQHRMRMDEVEAQIAQGNLQRSAQKINITGEGRKATIKQPPAINDRNRNLVDKRVRTDYKGRRHNVLSGPFGSKWWYPEQVDKGEVGEEFGGEAAAITIGAGGLAEGYINELENSVVQRSRKLQRKMNAYSKRLGSKGEPR